MRKFRDLAEITCKYAPMYDWDDLRVFLALARAGSLSETARRLRVEHTTVARRIEALERDLGLRLFDRLPRAWRLTEDGERILARTEEMEVAALAVARAADAADGAAVLHLRISAPPVLASAFVAPRLAPLLGARTDIRLDLVGEATAVSLTRRDADLAIRLSRPTDGDLVARRLAHMHYGLYASPAHVAGHPEADWAWCGHDDALGHVPQQLWLQRRNGGRPFVFRTNDLASLLAAAIAGIGVAALPHFLAATEPRLVCLEDAPEADREIWLVMHPDLRDTPRVRIVCDHLAAAFAEFGPARDTLLTEIGGSAS